VDVFEPGSGDEPTQINDLNPGIAPSGLFWTVAMPQDSVQVDLGRGTASMRLTDYALRDYGSIPNALFGGGPAPVPATVSFEVRWSGLGERVSLRNQAGGFAGDFLRNTAQMEWSATVGPYRFRSDAASTSSSDFAEIGRERSGVFLPQGGAADIAQLAGEAASTAAGRLLR
jgi:hypothetical protein